MSTKVKLVVETSMEQLSWDEYSEEAFSRKNRLERSYPKWDVLVLVASVARRALEISFAPHPVCPFENSLSCNFLEQLFSGQR